MSSADKVIMTEAVKLPRWSSSIAVDTATKHVVPKEPTCFQWKPIESSGGSRLLLGGAASEHWGRDTWRQATPVDSTGASGVRTQHWAEPLYRKLNEWRVQEPPRSQPGSVLPNKSALDLAAGFLTFLQDEWNARLVRDPEGGISIYLNSKRKTQFGGASLRYVSFSFMNVGDLLVTTSDRAKNETVVKEVREDDLPLELAAASLFLA